METTQVKTDEAVQDAKSKSESLDIKQDKPEAQSEQKPSKPIKTISEKDLRLKIFNEIASKMQDKIISAGDDAKKYLVYSEIDSLVDIRIKSLRDSATTNENWYVEFNGETYQCSKPEKMVKVIVGNDVHYVEPSAVTKRITYAAVYETKSVIYQTDLAGETVTASSGTRKSKKEAMLDYGFRIGAEVYVEHNKTKRYGRIVSESEIFDNLTKKIYPTSHFVALGLGRYDDKDKREKTAGWASSALKLVK